MGQEYTRISDEQYVLLLKQGNYEEIIKYFQLFRNKRFKLHQYVTDIFLLVYYNQYKHLPHWIDSINDKTIIPINIDGKELPSNSNIIQFALFTQKYETIGILLQMVSQDPLKLTRFNEPNGKRETTLDYFIEYGNDQVDTLLTQSKLKLTIQDIQNQCFMKTVRQGNVILSQWIIEQSRHWKLNQLFRNWMQNNSSKIYQCINKQLEGSFDNMNKVDQLINLQKVVRRYFDTIVSGNYQQSGLISNSSLYQGSGLQFNDDKQGQSQEIQQRLSQDKVQSGQLSQQQHWYEQQDQQEHREDSLSHITVRSSLYTAASTDSKSFQSQPIISSRYVNPQVSCSNLAQFAEVECFSSSTDNGQSLQVIENLESTQH